MCGYRRRIVAQFPLQDRDGLVLGGGGQRHDVHHRGEVEVDPRGPQFAAPGLRPVLQYRRWQEPLGDGGWHPQESGALERLDLPALLISSNEEPGARGGLRGGKGLNRRRDRPDA